MAGKKADKAGCVVPNAVRTERTKAEIIAAARKVWAKDGSYEYGTLRVVAKAAGRTTGAIFGNWASKEELFREAMGYPAPHDCAEVREALKASVGMGK